MKSTFIIVVFMISLPACSNKNAHGEFYVKNRICDKLWQEMYVVVQGNTFGTATYSDYLTDSINFRVYIGECDEYSSYSYDCSGDSIIVEKFKHVENRKQLVKTWVLSLSNLREDHKFE